MTISEAIKDIEFGPYSVRCLTNGHIAVGGWDRDAELCRLATLDADLNVVSQSTIEHNAYSMLELRDRLLVGMGDGTRMSLPFRLSSILTIFIIWQDSHRCLTSLLTVL